MKTGLAAAIFSDYPDVDVIRVENTYYMVSTTMHFMPGCVILRSYNLLDWEIASYVYDELDGTPGQRLWDDRGIYGQGMWAACLRYHKGMFYVAFVANDTHKTYLYTSDKIEGPWKKSEIKGFYHDLSILFDEDADGEEHVYLVSGNTQIRLIELEKDLSGPKKGGVDKIIVTDESERILGYEGSHFYKINGKYYITFIHWPKNNVRTEACFVSDNVEGPYSGGDVLSSDYLNWNSGVAQGGLIDNGQGNWYGMLFQDHGAMGRMPVLVPVTWENDFPVFGVNGAVPKNISVVDFKPDYVYEPLYCNDFCNDKGKMNLPWQWNHIPDKRYYKLAKNELVITTGKVVNNPCLAANTLTQRCFTEKCYASVELDFSKLNEGDFAGICALEGDYGFIAVTKKNGEYKLVVAERASKIESFKIGSVDGELPEIIDEINISDILFNDNDISDCTPSDRTLSVKTPYDSEKPDYENRKICLKMECVLSRGKERAMFSYYDVEKKAFVSFGKAKKLQYTLDQFVGCRFALFNYSTLSYGGSATFSNFVYTVN